MFFTSVLPGSPLLESSLGYPECMIKQVPHPRSCHHGLSQKRVAKTSLKICSKAGSPVCLGINRETSLPTPIACHPQNGTDTQSSHLRNTVNKKQGCWYWVTILTLDVKNTSLEGFTEPGTGVSPYCPLLGVC